MRNDLSKLAGKGAAGFFIGLGIWLFFSQPYTRVLASLSEAVLRAAERPAVTTIATRGTLMVIERSDLRPPATGQLALESTDLTFNFILLMTLFAASGHALADRNVFGFVGAALALVAVHVAAVVSFVKDYYASSFGAWSASHYGVVAREIWLRAPYFYGVVGVYAFAFALWWLFRPIPGSLKPASRRAKRRR